MGLAIQYTATKACPVMTCDSCGEKIVDWKQAIVIYGRPQSNGTTVPIVGVYHKGKCDPRIPYWQPLNEYLGALLSNHPWGVINIDNDGKKSITVEVPNWKEF